MAEDTFAVVLKEPINVSDTELLNNAADIYADALGIIKYDAMAKIRSAMGILIDKTSSEQAIDLADSLSKIDIDCIAVDCSKLPIQVKAETIKEVSITKEYFNVTNGKEQIDSIQWEDLRMLSTCFFRKIIPAPRSRPKGAMNHLTGLVKNYFLWISSPALYCSYNYMKKNLESKFELNKVTLNDFYIADLLLVKPFRKLRIYSNGCKFSYLGDRHLGKAEKNFQLVISDIIKHGKKLYLTPLAIGFQNQNSLGNGTFTDIHDFEKYNRWCLMVASSQQINKKIESGSD